ncbi:MAG: hypothetical protein AVDCRST_MAG01-01-4404 [uncultured Rubrobacteraceae bacterium]|uniref:Uncharacterized protein n=1 Tax=uncultured Rubrobacteraceae bacterium TaxID=349277 RepID=A0A6J4QQY7_9ACTN|nr:MAG: hypothetical protein AVDCRST_MAG01-01-4404 [uncultured Rubrobacteraceae bacterium]
MTAPLPCRQLLKPQRLKPESLRGRRPDACNPRGERLNDLTWTRTFTYGMFI